MRTLVLAFIIGRIDYCNGLLFGLTSVHLLKLQRLQNAAARLMPNVLAAVTQHQYYVHYLGFLSNFVLILKYFVLLLKVSAR